MRRCPCLDRPCAASRTICELLRREARGRAVVRPARPVVPVAVSSVRGALRPGSGADPFEGLERGPELGTRVGLALLPAQPLAVQQLGPRLIERTAALLVQGQGRAEQVFITVEQRPAAVHEGTRPALPGVARPGLEQREGLGRRLGPAEAYRRLDQVGGGPGGRDVEEPPSLRPAFPAAPGPTRRDRAPRSSRPRARAGPRHAPGAARPG